MTTPAAPKKGRPTKRTPARGGDIVSMLQRGTPRTIAVKCAGIAYDTFSAWVKDDPDFALKVETAEAKAADTAVASLRLAYNGSPSVKTVTKTYRDREGNEVVEVTTTEEHTFDWRAAAFLLERRWPAEFKQRQEVSGSYDLSKLTDEELNAYEAILIKCGAQ